MILLQWSISTLASHKLSSEAGPAIGWCVSFRFSALLPDVLLLSPYFIHAIDLCLQFCQSRDISLLYLSLALRSEGYTRLSPNQIFFTISSQMFNRGNEWKWYRWERNDSQRLSLQDGGKWDERRKIPSARVQHRRCSAVKDASVWTFK